MNPATGTALRLPGLADGDRRAHGATALRRLRDDDVAVFARYRADAGLARFQGWSPMDSAAARRFIAEMSGVDALRPGDWIQLAIADAADDRLLGDLGLFVAADLGHAEIGFTLAREAQRRGHATRAVRAALALLRETLPQRPVRAVTDERNAASVAVLQRCGFAATGARDAVFKGEPCREFDFEHRDA